MLIKALHQYDQDVETIFGLCHNPDFMMEKYLGVGARNIEVLECAGSEGRYHIKVKREVPAEVPALLKKFLNPWNTLVQSEQWEGPAGGPYHCKIRVEISGVPVSIEGEMELRNQSNSCISNVQLEVKCGIPLIGSKLADFVGSDAERAIQIEYEFIRNHLAKA
ncbi:MAG: DUF2505 domain-containing protein [Gammaproteobacteria bacterium]|nr:DUF2505 domain-containing protein [Gammaproteobacteria bacterium]MCP5196550.1 DUF2505 domain-containing protein [Gammaproteobacteria bacterium]